MNYLVMREGNNSLVLEGRIQVISGFEPRASITMNCIPDHRRYHVVPAPPADHRRQARQHHATPFITKIKANCP